MKNMLRILAISAIAFALTGILTPAQAEQKFKPKITISSQTGKWKQVIKEQPVRQIVVLAKRVSGGDDTYINLRFGDNGQTFPGGQRFPVTSAERQKIVVPANGMTPNGQPLVINAYNGSVMLEFVGVHYAKK